MSFLNNSHVNTVDGVKNITVTKLVTKYHVWRNIDGFGGNNVHDRKADALAELRQLKAQAKAAGVKLTKNERNDWEGKGFYIGLSEMEHIVTEIVKVTPSKRTDGRKIGKTEVNANFNGVDNLLVIFEHATVKELTHGLSWYQSAHADAIALANEFDTDLSTTCAVIAALSPSMRWDQNVDGARVVFNVARGLLSWDNVSIATYNSNRDKATDIARTGDTSILSGTKVTAFASNIYDPTSHEHVTIDRHAIQAWFGRYEGMATQIDDSSYALIEDDYRTAAELVGMRPCEFQAVIWVAWRRLNGLK